MQSGQINTSTVYLRVICSSLSQPPGSASQVPTTGIGTYNDIRILAESLPALFSNFITQRFDACDTERSIQGGIEISCIFQETQVGSEQFRTYSQLYNFGPYASQILCFSRISGCPTFLSS